MISDINEFDGELNKILDRLKTLNATVQDNVVPLNQNPENPDFVPTDWTSFYSRLTLAYQQKTIKTLTDVLTDFKSGLKTHEDVIDFFQAHWQLINGSRFSYMAMPHEPLTAILFECAELFKNDLFPEASIFMSADIKAIKELSTHILLDDNKTLSPVIHANHFLSVNADKENIARFSTHSPMTQKIIIANNQKKLNASLPLNLYARINEFMEALSRETDSLRLYAHLLSFYDLFNYIKADISPILHEKIISLLDRNKLSTLLDSSQSEQFCPPFATLINVGQLQHTLLELSSKFKDETLDEKHNELLVKNANTQFQTSLSNLFQHYKNNSYSGSMKLGLTEPILKYCGIKLSIDEELMFLDTLLTDFSLQDIKILSDFYEFNESIPNLMQQGLGEEFSNEEILDNLETLVDLLMDDNIPEENVNWFLNLIKPIFANYQGDNLAIITSLNLFLYTNLSLQPNKVRLFYAMWDSQLREGIKTKSQLNVIRSRLSLINFCNLFDILAIDTFCNSANYIHLMREYQIDVGTFSDNIRLAAPFIRNIDDLNACFRYLALPSILRKQYIEQYPHVLDSLIANSSQRSELINVDAEIRTEVLKACIKQDKFSAFFPLQNLSAEFKKLDKEGQQIVMDYLSINPEEVNQHLDQFLLVQHFTLGKRLTLDSSLVERLTQLFIEILPVQFNTLTSIQLEKKIHAVGSCLAVLDNTAQQQLFNHLLSNDALYVSRYQFLSYLSDENIESYLFNWKQQEPSLDILKSCNPTTSLAFRTFQQATIVKLTRQAIRSSHPNIRALSDFFAQLPENNKEDMMLLYLNKLAPNPKVEEQVFINEQKALVANCLMKSNIPEKITSISGYIKWRSFLSEELHDPFFKRVFSRPARDGQLIMIDDTELACEILKSCSDVKRFVEGCQSLEKLFARQSNLFELLKSQSMLGELLQDSIFTNLMKNFGASSAFHFFNTIKSYIKHNNSLKKTLLHKISGLYLNELNFVQIATLLNECSAFPAVKNTFIENLAKSWPSIISTNLERFNQTRVNNYSNESLFFDEVYELLLKKLEAQDLAVFFNEVDLNSFTSTIYGLALYVKLNYQHPLMQTDKLEAFLTQLYDNLQDQQVTFHTEINYFSEICSLMKIANEETQIRILQWTLSQYSENEDFCSASVILTNMSSKNKITAEQFSLVIDIIKEKFPLGLYNFLNHNVLDPDDELYEKYRTSLFNALLESSPNKFKETIRRDLDKNRAEGSYDPLLLNYLHACNDILAARKNCLKDLFSRNKIAGNSSELVDLHDDPAKIVEDIENFYPTRPHTMLENIGMFAKTSILIGGKPPIKDLTQYLQVKFAEIFKEYGPDSNKNGPKSARKI